MVSRLGGSTWRRIHQAVYVIGLLALIHFFQQTKADFTLPATIAGLFGWLMVYRAVAAWKGPELSTLTLFWILPAGLQEAAPLAPRGWRTREPRRSPGRNDVVGPRGRSRRHRFRGRRGPGVYDDGNGAE